jgi:hypothetical protein
VSASSGAVAAQVGAEVRMRMRSVGTLVALLAAFAAAILWIPDPAGRASSLSWRFPDGRVQAPIYDAAYIGFAASALIAILVALGGFYLVAGSVRRDRERGVGAILAATPLSNGRYLLGKFAASAAYLSVVTALALTAGLTAWLRFGKGPFDPFAFCVPFLLLSLPAVAITAAFALLFDVTPGLSGRWGYVAWFFVFSLLLVAAPMGLAGAGDPQGKLRRVPAIDPVGAATQAYLARQTVPGATGFSTGLEIRDEPFERVPWAGIRVTPGLVGLRAVNLLVALLPLGAALRIFDRFDPARRGRRALRAARSGHRGRVSESAAPGGSLAAAAPIALAPAAARPSAGTAVLAETRLIWESAGLLRWALLAAALVAGFVPGKAAAAAFLLLLVPAIAEVAAREDLSGTRALVFSQPGVPTSAVLWKTAALALFVAILGAPLAVRTAIASPARGAAAVAGLLAVAGFAAGFGFLTGGGKLFSGLYLPVWYMAASGASGADFTGTLSPSPSLAVSLSFLAGALILVAIAAARERLREKR